METRKTGGEDRRNAAPIGVALAALEKLELANTDCPSNERILFEQFARGQYLITQGFQLLAENNLTAEEWKKFRAYCQRTNL